MISVAKPRRGVGSGAGLAGAPGEAPGEADGAADAGLVADADAIGEPVVEGEPVAGAPLALAVADAVPDGAGVSVGVARMDGLGVNDSTGPGVSSESQMYDLPLAL
jgi:hypothetical protein